MIHIRFLGGTAYLFPEVPLIIIHVAFAKIYNINVAIEFS
jgi:hypothetical protein